MGISRCRSRGFYSTKYVIDLAVVMCLTHFHSSGLHYCSFIGRSDIGKNPKSYFEMPCSVPLR